MTKIIGVRFRNTGKAYYFDPEGLEITKNTGVIVETAKGMEYGVCVIPPSEVDDEKIVQPLRKVVRIATEQDLSSLEANAKKEESALEICKQKAEQRGLVMKLIRSEYSFDNSKIMFYYTADGRVDFRELVKDLAAEFHTRIELRQVGVRDESRMLGGLGMCGKSFCCATFLDDFCPVSIKMAKEQGLSINPVKISGACGRLMCCLNYEQESYEDLQRTTPRVDSIVDTPAGRGRVVDVSLLKGQVKVMLDAQSETLPKYFHKDELTVVKRQACGGCAKGKNNGDES